jgi:hypothetical protein
MAPATIVLMALESEPGGGTLVIAEAPIAMRDEVQERS